MGGIVNAECEMFYIESIANIKQPSDSNIEGMMDMTNKDYPENIRTMASLKLLEVAKELESGRRKGFVEALLSKLVSSKDEIEAERLNWVLTKSVL